MAFKVNQRIKVLPGWYDAGKRGLHLLTLEHEGRTWLIVKLHGETMPTVMMAGAIEIDDNPTLSGSHQSLPKIIAGKG